jgi:SAM-dependent methyltransferase
MQALALYRNPVLYDALVQRGPCETFYGALASEARGPVLELACGTGRLSNALAAKGIDVTGLDLSAAMLRRAKLKARRLAVAPSFVRGDMRSFTVGRRFELILLTCSSLSHMTSHADVLAVLRRIRRHLAPGGLFAFDVANPQLRELAGLADRGPRWISAAPGYAAQEELIDYDPVSQIQRVGWTVCGGMDGPVSIAPLALRNFFAQELELLLDSAGLALVARYGDFERAPFSAESPHQVCLAQSS